MSITGIIENGSIKLPPSMHLPDGMQVEIMLPEPSDPDGGPQLSNAAEQQVEHEAWFAQSARRLHEVWDNDADDVYNELLA